MDTEARFTLPSGDTVLSRIAKAVGGHPDPGAGEYRNVPVAAFLAAVHARADGTDRLTAHVGDVEHATLLLTGGDASAADRIDDPAVRTRVAVAAVARGADPFHVEVALGGIPLDPGVLDAVARNRDAREYVRIWHLTGLDPDDWTDHRFRAAPGTALKWHRAGFSPADAQAWAAFSVLSDPDVAAAWRAAGFAPAFVARLNRRSGAPSRLGPGPYVHLRGLGMAWRDVATTLARCHADPVAWVDAGLALDDAVAVAAHGLDAADHAAWTPVVGHDPLVAARLHGVVDPDAARRWLAAGFTPDDTVEWAMTVQDPDDAAAWHAAGFTPAERSDWLHAIVFTDRVMNELGGQGPGDGPWLDAAFARAAATFARRWADAGHDRADALAWSRVVGVDPDAARPWLDAGVDAAQAAFWAARRATPADAGAWLSALADAADHGSRKLGDAIDEWAEAGVTDPADVAAWRNELIEPDEAAAAIAAGLDPAAAADVLAAGRAPRRPDDGAGVDGASRLLLALVG